MLKFPRYAIYYVPSADSELYRFGANVLGYDAFSAEPQPFPDGISEIHPDWMELTAEPRKYGFHATLKAPFALAAERSEAELLVACDAFARIGRTRPTIVPVVSAIEGFIAVVPAQPSDQLCQLAQDCVSEFDWFRAALTASDRERRKPATLTPTQRDYLDRWGYPYVKEEFRFHMTLTGRLDEPRRTSVLATLRSRFSELDLAALPIDRIALLRQNHPDARFQIVAHHALQATTGS
jgi:putative phosphonate metabolism protein